MPALNKEKIRNFCIIAHIDHGKSTLADRMLEITGTVDKRHMKAQILDQMDIEQERGITIKLQPVKMNYEGYELNLIDTPGHVDFTYEVSRSLMSVEGAILLVDATQGIQAQTLANLYLALDQNLEIIPVINKIDLPNSQVEKVAREIVGILGCKEDEIYKVSAKTGEGVAEVLKAVILKVPAPHLWPERKDLRALIFDSTYDEYKGVIAYIRVFEGEIKTGQEIKFVSNKKLANVIEVGYFSPQYVKSGKLETGEIGYVVTGLRDVSQVKVGDTITLSGSQVELLPGFQEVKPMVFAGVFCKDGSDYSKLREAIEKLKLNDASLMYEPENSQALGFGFRCGFLGLLHLEIFQERLNREFDLDLIVTTPSVAYNVFYKDGSHKIIYNPVEFPDPTFIDYVEEPIMQVDIFTPKNYLGGIMQMTTEKRGTYINTEYLDQEVAILHYYVPLTQLIVDFYDKLKSVSSGYASLNYDFYGYQKAEVVKMDILVAEEKIEALSLITYRDSANEVGKRIVNILKNELNKQQFVIKIQAAINGKIIAAERISALKKDVTAKLYGGDWSRRQKLLEKQKKGKKKMMNIGKVDIPSDAFLAVLKK
ncbi:MAG: translation elongation factor 4 [Candidatus Buchananbacteria bacterium]|nr:translation elongation factor 4 [Candidatus Buchananbacteria bacterium]